MLPLIGGLISAGAGLLGGMMNNNANQQINAQNNAAQQAVNEANIAATERANEQNLAAQKEFAQHGLRWKTEDAARAGVHPLYALGAPAQSFSPSFVGATSGFTPAQHDPSAGNMIAQGGQDLGRAIASTSTEDERTKAFNAQVMGLQLERGQLENELLRTQIRRQITESGPAFPSVGGAPGQLSFHGNSWRTNPGTSDAQDMEDRYGDLVSSIYGVGVIGSDLAHNRSGPPAKSGVDYKRAIALEMAKQQLRAQLGGDPLGWMMGKPDFYRGIYQ